MPYGFMTIYHQKQQCVYQPFNGFTTVDIGCERGNNSYNMITRLDGLENTVEFLKLFEAMWRDRSLLEDVTDVVIENISAAYNENSPELIYFITLFNVFSEFLEDISEDVLPNEATGFKQSKIWSMLYDFQRDAVLVLCPKKLAQNWNTYKDNYVNNPIASDRLNYDVLFHTDLSRTRGTSNGLDLDRLNWGNYDLVVIDESHNFRNGGELSGEDQHENRYLQLLNRVILAGVNTKVLMLSATPVNNRFLDLKNQLALAYGNDPQEIDSKLNTSKSIDEIFRQAQTAFNAWSKLSVEDKTTDALLRRLDFDFFEVLDSVTIARSRKHIQRYYSIDRIGKFPERLKPLSYSPPLTDKIGAINYNEIYEQLELLNLKIYTPSAFIFPSKLSKYADLTHNKGENLTQMGREEGIRHLMTVNLLKRLESSVHSFQLTLSRILQLINDPLDAIKEYEKAGYVNFAMFEVDEEDDLDIDEQNSTVFTVGKKVRIDLADMDFLTWRELLRKDRDTLMILIFLVSGHSP